MSSGIELSSEYARMESAELGLCYMSGYGFSGLVRLAVFLCLQRWCRMELKKLTGSEDLTVAYICMALESNSEVADAINNVAQGSSANQFISEFIKCAPLDSRALTVYVRFNVLRPITGKECASVLFPP